MTAVAVVATTEALAGAVAIAGGRMIDRRTQEELFNEYGTPERVRRHCNAVAEAAVKLGNALNAAGYNLDLELIESAARIHDVARATPHHADAGYEFLMAKGYAAEAAIVKEHMTHEFNPVESINELDVVCMGDRTVKEDEYVGLKSRMEYLMQKPSIADDRKALIKSIAKKTGEYFEAVERVIGITFDELLG